MAVNILNGARRPGVPLGVRLDDEVRARRESQASRPVLRVVRPTPSSPQRSGDGRNIQEPWERLPAPAVVRCERVRPEVVTAPAPARARTVSEPDRIRRMEPKTDPMFDAHVEQARLVATGVRGAVRAAGAPSAAAPAGSKQPARLRLTLRGQRVLVALGFAVSIALGGLVGVVIGTEPVPEQTTTVVVKPGDSLWRIAESVSDPGRDLRPVMERIASLNGLHSPVISAGQTLVVPAE